MLIEYVHASEPSKKKQYDTSVSLKNNPFIKMSDDDWARFELDSFKKEKKSGNILFFRILNP